MTADRQDLDHPLLVAMGLNLVVMVVPFVVALLLSWATPCGRAIDKRFYELCAEIVPVVGLPIFLERGTILVGRIGERGLTRKLRAFTAGHVVLAAMLVLAGEAVALYAVATQTSTTFLAAASAANAILLLALLAYTTAQRVEQEGRARAENQSSGSDGPAADTRT